MLTGRLAEKRHNSVMNNMNKIARAARVPDLMALPLTEYRVNAQWRANTNEASDAIATALRLPGPEMAGRLL